MATAESGEVTTEASSGAPPERWRRCRCPRAESEVARIECRSPPRAETLPDADTSARAEAALAVLRRALDDPVLEVRREAALALGQVGDRESVDALVSRLGTDSEPVRRAAALALGAIPATDARDALLGALRGDTSVWREAAVALSHHHEPETIAGLAAVLEDGGASEHGRRGAALALGALLAGEPLSLTSPVGPSTFEDESGRSHLLL